MCRLYGSLRITASSSRVAAGPRKACMIEAHRRLLLSCAAGLDRATSTRAASRSLGANNLGLGMDADMSLSGRERESGMVAAHDGGSDQSAVGPSHGKGWGETIGTGRLIGWVCAYILRPQSSAPFYHPHLAASLTPLLYISHSCGQAFR